MRQASLFSSEQTMAASLSRLMSSSDGASAFAPPISGEGFTGLFSILISATFSLLEALDIDRIWMEKYLNYEQILALINFQVIF